MHTCLAKQTPRSYSSDFFATLRNLNFALIQHECSSLTDAGSQDITPPAVEIGLASRFTIGRLLGEAIAKLSITLVPGCSAPCCLLCWTSGQFRLLLLLLLNNVGL